MWVRWGLSLIRSLPLPIFKVIERSLVWSEKDVTSVTSDTWHVISARKGVHDDASCCRYSPAVFIVFIVFSKLTWLLGYNCSPPSCSSGRLLPGLHCRYSKDPWLEFSSTRLLSSSGIVPTCLSLHLQVMRPRDDTHPAPTKYIHSGSRRNFHRSTTPNQ